MKSKPSGTELGCLSLALILNLVWVCLVFMGVALGVAWLWGEVVG